MEQAQDSLPRPAAAGIGTLEDYKEGSLKYLEFLRQSISDDLSGLKVVLDGANGSTSSLLTKLYADLNVDFSTIATNPDGVNINNGVGSTHPEKLAREVVAQNAQAGLAFDGDGDRCIAVDEKGNIVDGDKIMFILGNYFKEHGRLKKDTIVTTVMSNLGLYKALEAHGIHAVQTAVGDRHVAAEMVKNGYNLGGEQSGHIIIFDVHNTGDGMLTGIQLLNVMKQTGKSLSELAAPVKTYPQKLVNVKVVDKKNWQQYSAITEAITEVEQALAGEGRVLVRPSGTESLLRIMVEARTSDLADQYTNQIAQVVQENMGL